MKRLVLFLIVAAALLAPSAALASGVVLKVQQATHLVAVTNGKTKVSLVHTAAKLRVGQRVALSGRMLRNGTLAASSIRVVGRAHVVHFRGLLLKKSGTRMVLSAGGAIISVKRGAARRTSSGNDTGPQPGTVVDVTATVSSTDELDEDNVTTVSADSPGGAIEGKLTLGTGKITVVSEHMALVINVPSTFDLSKFKTGDEVLAKFTQGADGTLTLTDLSGDDNVQEADDNDDGDDNGDDDHGDNGDNHGENHGGNTAPPAAAPPVHI
jgi:Cu/Ag efflux protein CusF